MMKSDVATMIWTAFNLLFFLALLALVIWGVVSLARIQRKQKEMDTKLDELLRRK